MKLCFAFYSFCILFTQQYLFSIYKNLHVSQTQSASSNNLLTYSMTIPRTRDRMALMSARTMNSVNAVNKLGQLRSVLGSGVGKYCLKQLQQNCSKDHSSFLKHHPMI